MEGANGSVRIFHLKLMESDGLARGERDRFTGQSVVGVACRFRQNDLSLAGKTGGFHDGSLGKIG